MKKIKTVLMTLFVCALGYGSYSAYDYITMSDAERFLLENIEALTNREAGGSTIHFDCARSTNPYSICYYRCSSCGDNYTSGNGFQSPLTNISGYCDCGHPAS